MQFDIAIEQGTSSTAWGIVVPALPGCFSAGDSLEEAMKNVRVAIYLHMETTAEDGIAASLALDLNDLKADPEYDGWEWGKVEFP